MINEPIFDAETQAVAELHLTHADRIPHATDFLGEEMRLYTKKLPA